MRSLIFLLITLVTLSVTINGKHEDKNMKRNMNKNQVSENIHRITSRNLKLQQKSNKDIFGQKHSNRNQDPNKEDQEFSGNSEYGAQNKHLMARRVTDPDYENKFPTEMARLKAEITRLLLRTSDGAAVSTRFTASGYTRYTYVKLQMIADIPNDDKYAGIPYFLMNRNDTTVRDLRTDQRASFLLSQSMNDKEHHECNPWPLKSEDVKCHKAVFVGDFVELSDDEANFAYLQFEKRYYVKRVDPTQYFVSKMNIKAIFIGEGEPLPLKDYYNARPYGWNIVTDQGDGPAIFPEYEVFTQASAAKNRTRK